MAADVRVKLHVSSINFPGGVVYDFMAEMGVEATLESKAALAATPPSPWGRSGRLEASIASERRSNQWGVNLHLHADTPYAKYVHGGTTGPIRRRGGKLMPVGKSQGHVTGLAKTVSGQSANPFLVKGLNAAIGRRSLYGLRPLAVI